MDTFDTTLSLLEAADRSDGWLAACEERQIYLALNREFVAALATMLADTRKRAELLNRAESLQPGVAQVDDLRRRAFLPGSSNSAQPMANSQSHCKVMAFP